MSIHSTSIIGKNVQMGNNVKIGPFCYIDGKINIGNNVELKSHVVIAGVTKIGDDCTIYPFASIGHPPQDLKYKGEESSVIIGKNNIIREYVTINPGTSGDKMITLIGDNCLLMVSSHVAHDCEIQDNVVIANNVAIAGHVVVENNTVIGGNSAIHQFVKIGKYSMIGGMSGIENNVPPYSLVYGDRAGFIGVNIIGLKRAGFSNQDITTAGSIYNFLFEENNDLVTMQDKIKFIQKKYEGNFIANEIITFILNSKFRALCKPKKNG